MSLYGLNLSNYGCIMSKYGFSDRRVGVGKPMDAEIWAVQLQPAFLPGDAGGVYTVGGVKFADGVR